jgi:membrane protease YdiL (CAAX protease family)
MATPPSIPPPISTPAPIPEDRGRVAPVWHTVVFIVVTLALTGFQAYQQPKLATVQIPRRSPLYLVMITFELIMLGYVWLGVRSAGKSFREIIRGKWNTGIDFAVDVGVVIGFWVVVVGMLSAMRLILGTSREGFEALKGLLPQTYTETVIWVCLSITAGFCEEFIFRGYLQRQFLAFTRRPELAIVFQALIFGAAHLYQGWKNAVVITVYGTLFGALAAWRKSLRPGMMQHAAQDSLFGLIGNYVLRHHPL